MKIGMIGLGKLGLPVILAIENRGHTVYGWDISDEVLGYILHREIPYIEEGTPELLEKTGIKITPVPEMVEKADIIFMAIQTPHDPLYEGVNRLPEKRKDFDYSYLKEGVEEVANAASNQDKPVSLVIISTVLPGTMEKEIKPLLGPYVHLCYNPFFIAMGTTRRDFEDPEFVLLGTDSPHEALGIVREFYKTINDAPVFETSVTNAELIKVVYNTFISSKIAFINTIMELCHKVGADVDQVSDALALANRRIISPKYLRGGMGDGGGCHPRDNIALSWLARKVGLSYDYFEQMMLAREKHTEWLADLLASEVKSSGLPLIICGTAFKKNINLTVGSPVRLLKNMLGEKGVGFEEYDPFVFPHQQGEKLTQIGVYFIAMNHDCFKDLKFPEGSKVIDVWGIIPDQDGVEVVGVGR